MDVQNIMPQPEEEVELLTLNLEGNSAKKPVRRWPVITAIIIAVLAVVSIITVFAIKYLNQSPEERVITIVDVEKQASDYDFLGAFGEGAPMGQSVQINFEINKLALNMIRTQYPELEKLGELNDLSIDTALERNNGMSRIVFGLELGEDSAPQFEVILDSKANALYIVSELFSGNYMKFDLSSMSDEVFDAELVKVLLSAILDSEMTDRYFNNFLELMTVQETKTEKVSANDVYQECIVYSAQIDLGSAGQLFADYLKELKEGNSLYAQLLDSAIEEIQKSLNSDEKLGCLYWTVYTDKSGKIIGRNIRDDDEQLFYYLLTADGEDLGFELYVSTLEIAGNAVVDDGLLDGTFIVREDGVDYLKISIDEFDIEACKNGMPNGSVEIEPTDDFMGILFGEMISLPVSLTIDFESTQSEQNVTLSLMEMATIRIKSTQYTPDTISLPEGNEINGEDSNALSRLLGIVGAGVIV